jgi:hypothetical protein
MPYRFLARLRPGFRRFPFCFLLLLVLFLTGAALAADSAGQIDLAGAPGSASFGKALVWLPNGNLVVSDPLFDSPGQPDTGAVYLYRGSDGALLDQFRGAFAGDQAGSDGILVLPNSNYLVVSPQADTALAADTGAITFCTGDAGCSGDAISSANSLIGSSEGDELGQLATVLANGHYVAGSHLWDNGGDTDAGAVTWCSGVAGCTGALTAANSLHGGPGDRAGSSGVTPLANGSYLVRSPLVDTVAFGNVGAVTWCSGTALCGGRIDTGNSRMGAIALDRIGQVPPVELPGGGVVVAAPLWNNGLENDAGAVTFCSGAAPCTGQVSSANSLVGVAAFDRVGSHEIRVLASGDYLVASPYWRNGAAAAAGAVTQCNGLIGCTGVITVTNSLAGANADDLVGWTGVVELNNGAYVVISDQWNRGAALLAGAVTWCPASGCANMVVSTTNSLAGTKANDRVGTSGVLALASGNYVVISPEWDNGSAADAGAVTWCSGLAGCSGLLDSNNSLTGAMPNDRTGDEGVLPLANGNYVVSTRAADTGALADTGAVTWCSGLAGCSGNLSAANSLIGASANDEVGDVTPLNNGHFVVSSRSWDNGLLVDAGATTWCNGVTGCTGIVGGSNSLVGTTAGEYSGDVMPLADGDYVVATSFWDNGAAVDAGAVTWCSGTGGCTGVISAANSLIGAEPNGLLGGFTPLALPNGAYVVPAPGYGITDTGAIRHCAGDEFACRGLLETGALLQGSSAGDQIGGNGVTLLPTGHYVVQSPEWDNGSTVDAGALTWCDGNSGCTGIVTVGNSLAGAAANDRVGGDAVIPVAESSFVVVHAQWDHNGATDSGAVSWCSSYFAFCTGVISTTQSVLASTPGGGSVLIYRYHPGSHRLAVGRPDDQIATIFADPFNRPPAAIQLQPAAIAENAPISTVAGLLLTDDPDSLVNGSDTFTYTLAAGAGDDDNGYFAIVGSELRSAAALDFEISPSLAVRIRTTDRGGLALEQPFTVTVSNVNETPTALDLSSAVIAENEPAGTVVGLFSGSDPDTGDSLSFALTSGSGSADNSTFTINGNSLQTTMPFDFETKNRYAFHAAVSDGALTFSQAFTVTVTDVNDTDDGEPDRPLYLPFITQ